MCGIIGISYGPGGSGVEEWSPSEMACFMFPAIVHRGPHAYGWMYKRPGDPNIVIQKWEGRADTPEALAHMADIPDELDWFVGHVRWYTHGDPSDMRNNHPIPHGNIVGVHNGVIRNHDEVLRQTGREDPKTQVDSEAIFAAVNKWGHRAGLRRISGDMVAVYVDRAKPETLHVARSYNRPLVLCRTSSGAMVFASEGNVIDSTKIEHTQFSTLSSNRLLRVREGKVRGRVNYRELVQGSGGIPVPVHGPSSLPGWRGTLPPSRAPRPREERKREAQSRGILKSTRGRRLDLHEHLAMAREAQAQRDTRSMRGRNLQDHDKWGAFRYYKERLMTEEEYQQAIAEDGRSD